MNAARLNEITGRYAGLRVAIIGDFCLDRYLEIDPSRHEISIETGLPVYNVVNVRSQPGAAGTILNNLVALGIGEIFAVGFCGQDGEGFELQRTLGAKKGVNLQFFRATAERKTFTYCKPLLVEPGKPPLELNRLDQKNWSSTPDSVQHDVIAAFEELAGAVDAIILLDQVDIPETGVVTARLLSAIAERKAKSFVIADSRRGLTGFPPVCYKMNRAELGSFIASAQQLSIDEVCDAAARIARCNGQPVIVTMPEQGIIAAGADGAISHVPSLPLRGEIDVVGAGDSVTANVTAALAAGASLGEAIEIAVTAASIVIHQLGTTGTASVPEIAALLPIP